MKIEPFAIRIREESHEFERENYRRASKNSQGRWGLVLEGGKRTADELAKIAAAAKRSGSTVIFRKTALRKTQALTRIAAAGKGHVIFE